MSRPSLVRTIYAALLHLHPAARRGFAPDMAATFDTLLAAARARGRFAVLALLVREIAGLVRGTWSSHGPSVGLPAVPSRRMSAAGQDARYALRLARRQPGFTATIVVTLGLGIGANTAIVSLANALLLQRLPFADPSRLVMLWEEISSAGFPRNTPAHGNYADWTRSIPALAGVAAIGQRDFNLTGVGDPEKIGGAGVTANLFSVLGVQPIVGRVWRPDEDVPGQHVVVLSYGLWQRRFGRDPGIVGRAVTFNDIPYTVIGVMPAGFEFISPDLQVWTPINFDAAALQNRGTHYLWVVGRMATRSTLEELDVQLRTLATRLQHDEPQTNRRVGMYAVPLRDDYLGETRMVLALLLAAAGLVLLIACANVANLLLSRSATRARETATRAALGAPRARLIRQLLTESFLLSCVGGGLGLVVARLSFGTLTTLVPASLVEMSHLELDWRVLATTAVISCATAMLFGVMPALRGSRSDLALGGILRSSRGAVGGPTRIGNALVVAEIAIATIVLISAGLIATSFRAASRLPLGFVPDRVLTMQLQLPRVPFAAFDRRLNFVDAVLARVRALPGVESAGYTSAVPFVWKGGSGGFFPEDLPIDRSLPYDAINRVVSPGYMETLRMTLRSGRFFDNRDTADGLPTAIINERMAREYFPGVDPIGRRFSDGSEGRDSPWRTIVGIVADTQALGLDRPAHAEMYFPLAQSARNWMWPRDLAVRSVGDPAALVAAIRTAVQEINPAQPISKIMSLDDIVATELQVRRTQTSLMMAFAGIALLLAAVGIYGLLSYTVSARTTEIGVRLALGGDPSRIRRLVVRQGMTLAIAGLGIGVLGAAWTAGFVEPLLFQVAPRDPWTFGVQAGVLAIVCLAAVYVPARRASRVDPLTALRTE